MYNLKNIPIFASNYNLNNMLRVQEICKEQGITMQDLAKKMGVTYQALYAAVSGNPTIGKLGDIAKALEVEITDLIEPKKDNDFIAFIDYKGKLRKATSIKKLEEIIADIKFEEMTLEAKNFRINSPYCFIYDVTTNIGIFLNREYQHLEERNGICSIYDVKSLGMVNIDLSQLTENEEKKVFQEINSNGTLKIGYFYTDNTNPFNKKDLVDRKRLESLYKDRITRLAQLIDINVLGYNLN